MRKTQFIFNCGTAIRADLVSYVSNYRNDSSMVVVCDGEKLTLYLTEDEYKRFYDAVWARFNNAG